MVKYQHLSLSLVFLLLLIIIVITIMFYVFHVRRNLRMIDYMFMCSK